MLHTVVAPSETHTHRTDSIKQSSPIQFDCSSQMGQHLSKPNSEQEPVILLQKQKMATSQLNIFERAFRLHIPVKSLQKFESPKMIVGGVPWKFGIHKVTKRKRNADPTVIGISLICGFPETEPKNSNWSIEAAAICTLVASDGDIDHNQSSITKIPMTEFNGRKKITKIDNIISLDRLTDEKNGFVRRKEIVVEIMITTHPLYVSSGMDSTSAKFRVVIEDVLKLETIISPKVMVRGISWYARFDKNDDHLSFSMTYEKGIENLECSFNVTGKIVLLSPTEDMQPFEQKFKNRFYYGANDWGFTKFMKWDDLLTYAKGNSIFFEISFSVGSWKPIWKTECEALMKVERPHSRCAICFDEFEDQNVMSTVCGHLYCARCIGDSLRVRTNCPMCNAPAAADDLRRVYLWS